MNKKEFIYTMLKNYGKYTKDDINRLVSDTNKITIQKKKKFFIQMYNLTFYLEYEKLYNLVLEININEK